ncbi:hypothetical protein Tco_1429854 [Tanacetum coccineum]
MSTLTFADTYNMVAFLEKPIKSNGFHEIIDFLNANQIRYALTVNPIIYTSCIQQFWATAKANTVNANQEEGVDSGIPTNSHQTPITTQPSSSISQKKQSRRKQRKDTAATQEETQQDDSVPTPSNDPPLSGEDSMQLSELMLLCTNLQKQVLDLEKAKDAQAKEIAGLKKRDKESLGAQEDASKQGRIVDETQERSDDAEMFDTDDLHGDEVIMDMAVGEKQEKSAKVDQREVDTAVEDSVALTILVSIPDEGVTAAKIDEITPISALTTVIDELTLAQTLIEIKSAKPKVVTTVATTTTIRPKARGVLLAKDFIVEEWLVEISGKKDESSSKRAKITQDSSAKRAGDKLEFDKSKKQKTDKNEEVEVDNEAELKKNMVTVKDNDIAIDAIPLATKPLVIIEYKLIREGIMEHYQLIRADGSFKRYSFMIRMLQGVKIYSLGYQSLTFFLDTSEAEGNDMVFLLVRHSMVTEILKKFGFSDVKTASTPMETHKPLLKDVDGEDVDEHMYRSMIGSLMYLISLRPDIMLLVYCVCGQIPS